jgi:Big-like domain-containing protein/VCBS repeat protein/FG-GAP repeat protein
MTRHRHLQIRIQSAVVPCIAVLAVLIALAATATAQNPVPFIDQPLVPDATAPGGAGFTLTVNGARFVSGSVVNWNGSPRPTTLVSSSRLTATILASDITKASTAAVTVVNPSPGGGVSNTQYFSIAVPEAFVSFLPVVTYPSGVNGGYSLAAADLNGDGKLDLVVVSTNGGYGSVAVLLGNGDGTFQPEVTYDPGDPAGPGGTQTVSVAVADVNGDGKPDLVVANNDASNTVGVLLGNGDGTFQPVVTYNAGGSPWSVAVADVNGDGKADIIVGDQSSCYGCSGPGLVGVLLGNGDGTFQPVVTYSSGGYSYETSSTTLALADLNGDGKLDIVMTNYCSNACNYPTAEGNASVLLGNGDGTFQPAVIYGSGGYGLSIGALAVADVNGDGKPDLLVANSNCSYGFCEQGTVGVLLGNGDGTFQPAVLYGSGVDNTSSVAVGDVNGDGKPDLVVTNFCAPGGCTDPGTGSIGVLLGNGDGTFQPAVAYNSGGFWGAFSTVVADVNGDGRPDLLAVNFEGNNFSSSVAVLLNRSTSPPCIGKCATSIALASSLNPSIQGQSITFTATVTSTGGAPPSGEFVTFYNGSVFLGSAPLSGGNASLRTSSLQAGILTITASYGGDANFAANTSPGLRQVVNTATKFGTATTLVSSLNPSIYGQEVTWTAAVMTSGPTAPTGKVNFNWSVFTIGTATLNASGVATLTRSLNADSYPLTAVYVGDTKNVGSASPILNQVVTQATSSATITSSLNPSTQGQSVTFTAKITSPTTTPTGPVTFTSGKTTLGTVELSRSKATFTTSTLAVGSTAIKATYSGDSNIAESSASVTQTVHP